MCAGPVGSFKSYTSVRYVAHDIYKEHIRGHRTGILAIVRVRRSARGWRGGGGISSTGGVAARGEPSSD